MLRDWIEGVRPKTLPAAAMPVLLGSAEAFRMGSFVLWVALVCLAFALLAQMGTNLANDYFDFARGADTRDRVGPERLVASGRIAPASMLRASWIAFAAAFAVGLLLAQYRGWELLLVGALSVACGYGYTGGPFPLAYKGLGDVFVVAFFGLVATVGTYYVLVGAIAWPVAALGAALGLLANNLLVVNNYRDFATDAQAGKRTTVVRFGRRFGLWLFGLQTLAAFGLWCFYAWGLGSLWALLPLAAAPLAVRLVWRLPRTEGRALNGLLAVSAGLLLLFGVLAAVGIVLAS